MTRAIEGGKHVDVEVARALGYVNPRCVVDLTGERIGKMTVLGLARAQCQTGHWTVRCSCGTRKVLSNKALWRGRRTGVLGCGKPECRYGPLPVANPLVPCACGCGKKLRQFRPTDKWQRNPRRFLTGHGSPRRWTYEDDQVLRRLYRQVPVDVLVERLGRSRPQVRQRAIDLRLTANDSHHESAAQTAKRHRRNEHWVKLALTYAGISCGVSGQGPRGVRTYVRVDPDAADQAVADFAKAIAARPLRGYEGWSAAEEAILRENAPGKTLTELSILLWRSRDSVMAKSKELQIEYGVRPAYAGNTEAIIRSLGPRALHRTAIAKATKAPLHVVSGNLQRLRRAGRIENVGAGVWRRAEGARC